MKIYNFEVEEKFHVKFDEKSVFDSFEADEISRDPLFLSYKKS